MDMDSLEKLLKAMAMTDTMKDAYSAASHGSVQIILEAIKKKGLEKVLDDLRTSVPTKSPMLKTCSFDGLYEGLLIDLKRSDERIKKGMEDLEL